MVAAIAANPGLDGDPSAPGSLLVCHRQICDPRWRLHAAAWLAPVCAQFGIPLERLVAEPGRGVAAAACAPAWRDQLEPLLVSALAAGGGDGAARLVEAMWTRSWRATAVHAVGAMLSRGDHARARQLAALGRSRRYAGALLDVLLRRGFVAHRGGHGSWPRVVANLDADGAERAFEPSLPLLGALIATIVGRDRRARCADAEDLARRLDRRERPIAEALLARLSLELASADDARARVRAIRERSIRAGGYLLLARAAARHDLDLARRFAAAIETGLLAEAAALVLARACYARGAIRDAVRELRCVADPRLAAGRELMLAELRLTTRRSRERRAILDPHTLARAYRAPAWTEIDADLGPDALADSITAAALVRLGSRSPREARCFEYAAHLLAPRASCERHRERWLDLVARSGVDVDDAIAAMQHPEHRAMLDALRATRVAMLARDMAAAPIAVATALGLAGQVIDIRDPRSHERAAFDEAVALSAAAPSRRRVLIAASQHCLRSALARPDAWARDVIGARLRTLVHLGGSLASDAIRKALATLPAHRAFTADALAALALLDARGSANIVLARANELHHAGVDVARALRIIEARDGLPGGFSRAYAYAALAIERQGYTDAQRWLAELLALARTRPDALSRLLHGLAGLTVVPPAPAMLIAELARVPLALVDLDHSTIAARLARDSGLLEALLLAQPPEVDERMTPWTTAEWRALVSDASAHTAVLASQVHRFARRIGRRSWFDPLRRADLVELGATEVTPFRVDRHDYRLRLLDKRRDLLTYLRFADVPARSCFRSDGNLWTDRVFRTRECSIEAWKDPLTLCLRVERWQNDAFRPRGFLFGSFATLDDRPALVMNSLHVSPNAPDVRVQVMRALERAVCAPLDIRHLGIANVFHGRGELPPGYAARTVHVMRYRALTCGELPIRDIYDDIEGAVNEPSVVGNLHWATL